jgi:parallel beta-helix repeat protein
MPAKLRPRTAPAMLVSLATFAAFAATGAIALGGAPSPASHVSCGDTITTDTTLDSDLTGCPSNGIVIGADDITLDLNGHTVAGDGEPVKRCRRDEICDVGLVNDGHDGVTLSGGPVHGFASGVFVGRARQNRVLNISSSRNTFFGFVIAQSSRSVVRDSSGNDNPEPDGDGIGIFASRGLRIVGNSFRRNALGMHVEDSSDILIARNRFARNPHMGILMEANRNQVRGNRCTRNGECLVVAPGNRNVVSGNRSFRDNGGIAIEKGRGNLVARNVVLHARWEGILLGINKPPIGGAARNVARGNLVRGGRRRCPMRAALATRSPSARRSVRFQSPNPRGCAVKSGDCPRLPLDGETVHLQGYLRNQRRATLCLPCRRSRVRIPSAAFFFACTVGLCVCVGSD